MVDSLAKLFGSQARVKLLRLFLFNPGVAYTVAEAALRARVPNREVSRELAMFAEIRLLNKYPLGRLTRYGLNREFAYLGSLQSLLLNATTRADDIYERIKSDGQVKLVVASGIFVGDLEGRVDLLIVADKVKEDLLERHLQILESEIGKEIRYTLLSTQDFFYRLNVNDHLVRDVFDFSHRIIFDRLDIGLK